MTNNIKTVEQLKNGIINHLAVNGKSLPFDLDLAITGFGGFLPAELNEGSNKIVWFCSPEAWQAVTELEIEGRIELVPNVNMYLPPSKNFGMKQARHQKKYKKARFLPVSFRLVQNDGGQDAG